MSVAKKVKESHLYSKFNKINGSHPLKSVVPNGFIDYPARKRKGGKVKYFNYDLAKEMGLIPQSHDNELTPELEEKILDTFSIQIINEFDQLNNRTFSKEDMKEGQYMATRYLQLQHEDKKGRTSGDGRSIWNGQIKHKGMTWDISSCGTGATRLSPATSKYDKFFETGDPSISYGCGYAEVDEGLATSLMSKIFNANGMATERTLGIIEFKNNIAINIRAHNNLLRPSHFLLYLKQDDLESLQSIVDYYIDQEVSSGRWSECPKNHKKYDFFLDKVCHTFAKTVADFEDDYIFCWIDWDGDNILMDGGIIDYGSIRQFGAFHHEYRYDDVERFSTNILEQKSKAKYIIQSFIQSIEYIKTGTKQNLNSFNSHKVLDDFESHFEFQKNRNLLYKMGFTEKKIKQTLKRHEDKVTKLRKLFSYFEKVKSKKGVVKISDGVTCDAVFNMRTFLREMPQILISQKKSLSAEDFIELIKTHYAIEEDLELSSYRRQKIKNIQNSYKKLIKSIASLFQMNYEDLLLELSVRSHVINKTNRMTGDAATYVVEKLANKKLKEDEIFSLINDIVQSQNLIPGKKAYAPKKQVTKELSQIFDIITEFREGI